MSETVAPNLPGKRQKKRRNPVDPPAEYRFKAGEVHNPLGRPKEIYRPLYRKLASKPLEELERLTQDRSKLTGAEAVVLGTIFAGAKGKTQAAVEIADRSDGRVPIAVTGADGAPLVDGAAVVDRIVSLLEAARARRAQLGAGDAKAGDEPK